MGSLYDGIPADIVFPTPISISSSTNASPIAVTTSSPHNLLTGAKIRIDGHLVNTNANGIWTITRTGASTFTLNGSTGNGVGVATGTVQEFTYGAPTTIPSDGDPRNAASVNVPYQTLLDRSSVVLLGIGGLKAAAKALFIRTNSLSGNSQWASIAAGTLTGGVANALTAQVNVGAWFTDGVNSGINVNSVSGTNGPIFSISGLAPGDLMVGNWNTTGTTTSTSSGWVTVFGAFAAPGTTPTFPTGYSQISTPLWLPSDNVQHPLSGFMYSRVPNNTTTFYFGPVYTSNGSGAGQSPTLTGDAFFDVTVYRATGVPQ